MWFVSPPPSTNALYVYLSKSRRVPSKQYAAWQKIAFVELMAQKAKRVEGMVEIEIYAPVNPRRDLDGYIKSALDLLVKCELIEDDRFRIVKRLFLRWHDSKMLGIQIHALKEWAPVSSPVMALEGIQEAP